MFGKIPDYSYLLSQCLAKLLKNYSITNRFLPDQTDSHESMP